MNTGNLFIGVFCVFGAISIFIFCYCTWLDRHDGGSGKNSR